MSLLDSLIEADLVTPPVSTLTEFQREIWICLRTDGGTQRIFGAGTQDDPYDGSTAEKFDEVVRLVAFGAVPNPTIRIGPGVFETRGGILTGWFAKNGRIIGSGMFVTSLKLIDVSTADVKRAIVQNLAGFPIVFFELSDLTLDCNIAGQPNTPPHPYPRVCVMGIEIGGSNIALRRVRCINWATRTPTYEFGKVITVSHECFPIFVAAFGNAPFLNNVIEDCIVELPGRSNARECTCISLGGGEASHVMGYHRAGVIRNCLVNGQTNGVSNKAIVITSISAAASSPYMVTVTFAENHNKVMGDYVYIRDVLTGASPNFTKDNPYNGYFKVESTPANNSLTYQPNAQPGVATDLSVAMMGDNFQAYTTAAALGVLFENNRLIGCNRGLYHDTYANKWFVARNNYFRDVYEGVSQFFGKVEDDPVGTGSISLVTGQADYNVIFTMNGGASHSLEVGDAVQIGGGDVAGFRGPHVVTVVPSASVFGFKMASPPTPSGATPYSIYDIYTLQYLGVEDNVIDLMTHPVNNVNGGPPYGLAIGGFEVGSGVYAFGQVVVRGNIIRHTDGAADTNWAQNSVAVEIDYAESVLIEDNVITLEVRVPPDVDKRLVVSGCKTVRTFNNQDTTGKRVMTYDTAGFFVKEWADDVDDAILMYFLNK